MISNELSYIPFSKWRLDNKSFRDQVKKQNFSTFHMGILEIFADVILTRAETIKSSQLTLQYVGLFSLVTTFQKLTEKLPF